MRAAPRSVIPQQPGPLRCKRYYALIASVCNGNKRRAALEACAGGCTNGNCPQRASFACDLLQDATRLMATVGSLSGSVRGRGETPAAADGLQRALIRHWQHVAPHSDPKFAAPRARGNDWGRSDSVKGNRQNGAMRAARQRRHGHASSSSAAASAGCSPPARCGTRRPTCWSSTATTTTCSSRCSTRSPRAALGARGHRPADPHHPARLSRTPRSCWAEVAERRPCASAPSTPATAACRTTT